MNISLRRSRLASVILLLVMGMATSATAGYYYPVDPVEYNSSWHFSGTLGLSYHFHYDRSITAYTPPDTNFGTAALNYWYGRTVGFYTFLGLSPGASVYGLGAKLPMMTFVSPVHSGSFFREISMQLVGDVMAYSFPQTPGSIYDPYGVVPRGGFSILWTTSLAQLQIEATLMATVLVGNFFLAPYVGLGFGY